MKTSKLFFFFFFVSYLSSQFLNADDFVLRNLCKISDEEKSKTENFAENSSLYPYIFSTTQEALYLGGGITSFTLGYLLQKSINDVTLYELSQLSKNDINSLDRFATNFGCKTLSNLSDYVVGIIFLSPTLLLFDEKIQQQAFSTIVLYGETMLYAGALPMLTKKIIPRFRPYTYNNNFDILTRMNSDSRTSFFSGHTCVAFASAVFLSSVFSDFNPNSNLKTYVWLSSLSAATFVGYLRVSSGYHFPTDVIVGALVGSSIGYLIPYFHKEYNESQSANVKYIKEFTILPSLDNQTLGISFNIKF